MFETCMMAWRCGIAICLLAALGVRITIIAILLIVAVGTTRGLGQYQYPTGNNVPKAGIDGRCPPEQKASEATVKRDERIIYGQKGMDRLVKMLGDPKFTVREYAMKQLEKIGEKSLKALQDGEKAGDLETRRRAQVLLRRIGTRAGIRVANGMVFKLVADKEWIIPAKGAETTLRIAMTVTNNSDRAQRLCFATGAKLLLEDSSRKPLSFFWGQEATPKDVISPPLAPGQTFSTSFKATLIHANVLRFYSRDDASYFREFTNLRPGTYHVSLTYENRDQSANGDVPLWVGRVQTPFQPVLIRHQDERMNP